MEQKTVSSKSSPHSTSQSLSQTSMTPQEALNWANSLLREPYFMNLFVKHKISNENVLSYEELIEWAKSQGFI
jgi:hypothetical protein